MDPDKSSNVPLSNWNSSEKQSAPPPYHDNPGYPNPGYPPPTGYPSPSGYPAQQYGAPVQQYGAPGGQPYVQAPYPGQTPYPGQAPYPGQPPITVQPTVYVVPTPLATPLPDYLGYSIFTMLCCCLPLGVAALVYSISTRNANMSGHQQIAEKNSRMARILNHSALGIGLTFLVLYIIYIIVMFVYLQNH